MDETIKKMLSGYELGLNAYRDRLGESNETLKKATGVFRKLCGLAESAGDMTSFYSNPEVTGLSADLSALLTELAKEKPARSSGTVPPASAAAAGYHLAYDQLPKEMGKTRAVYERIFEIEKSSENALVFTRAMAEEGLFLKMSAVALLEKEEGLRENAERLSLPVMVNYHEKANEIIPTARSIAELEYRTGLEAEVSIYQNLWDTALLNTTATLLGNAIAGWMLTQSEDERQEVENSYRFIADFYGLDFDALFGVPRIRDHFEKIVFESVKKDMAQKGTDSPEALLASFKAVVDTCLKGREPVATGPERNRKLVLWGIETDMAGLEKAYRTNFYKRL
ncbi:MAG: hypothetical protein JW807_08250 [Spirochaetes bacterium]|nr:hypothetical protein [Spirochaetota bacterium]